MTEAKVSEGLFSLIAAALKKGVMLPKPGRHVNQRSKRITERRPDKQSGVPKAFRQYAKRYGGNV